MVLCQNCNIEMEKGIFVARGMSMTGGSVNTYWCKERGFWKAKDKINLGTNILNALQFDSFICKKCKLITFKY